MNTLLYETILQTQCFPHAAIIRRKDNMIKAKTINFPLNNDDINKFTFIFDHPTIARDQGMMMGDQPYRVIRADSSSIYGKLDQDIWTSMKTLSDGKNSTLVMSTIINTTTTTTTTTTTATATSSPPLNNTNKLLSPSQPNIYGGSTIVQLVNNTDTGVVGVQETTTITTTKPERDKTIVEYTHVPLTTSTSKSYHGIIICRTGMYLLVGIYDRHPGMAVEVMERLADWFRSKHR